MQPLLSFVQRQSAISKIRFLVVNFFRPDGEGSERGSIFGISLGGKRIGEGLSSIVVALICGLALVPSLFWVLHDRRVWPWDQAWYGEVSVDLWYLLTHSPGQWLQLMLNGIGMKPPGVTWLGQIFVPFRSEFPSVEAILLVSVVLTQLAVLSVVYQLGSDLSAKSRSVALLGVIAAAGGQAFVGLSHQYFVEPLQTLAIVWTVLAAFRSREWPRFRTLIHFGGATLLGIMAKASTPLYVLVPAAIILFNLVRSRQPWGIQDEWKNHSSKAIVFGVVLIGSFGALWYWRNIAAVIQHVREASSGEIALAYGFRASLVHKTAVWLRFMDQGFFEPYLGWALTILTIPAVLAIFTARISVSVWRPHLIIVVLSSFQIGLVILTFSLNDAVETRYLLGLLPYVTAIAIVLCSLARYRLVLILLFAACLAQWFTVNRASFEPANTLANQFPWLLPITVESTSYREVEETVQRTSVSPGYDVVAIEEPWINANSLAFFAAKNRLTTGIRSYYTSVGYAQKDPAAAIKRIDEFSARFVITLDEPFQSEPNFLNLVTLPVLRELKSSQSFMRVPFTSKKGILIFKRRANGHTSDGSGN
jgi:hypothetical protein